jgi:ATP-binding cassette subfamily C (CFTR/MRP) protein 1
MIRRSVIGVCEFDESWYNYVIHACALDVDIQQLPGGYDATIGRQRLALARAVYSRKRILLLDDVLSGLD